MKKMKMNSVTFVDAYRKCQIEPKSLRVSVPCQVYCIDLLDLCVGCRVLPFWSDIGLQLRKHGVETKAILLKGFAILAYVYVLSLAQALPILYGTNIRYQQTTGHFCGRQDRSPPIGLRIAVVKEDG